MLGTGFVLELLGTECSVICCCNLGTGRSLNLNYVLGTGGSLSPRCWGPGAPLSTMIVSGTGRSLSLNVLGTGWSLTYLCVGKWASTPTLTLTRTRDPQTSKPSTQPSCDYVLGAGRSFFVLFFGVGPLGVTLGTAIHFVVRSGRGGPLACMCCIRDQAAP